ncbi:MAG: polyamine aminopropyltransferase [Syntrophomonadaceae bacterium]|jgi:spermidine synthase|nr:polyamine aminopropyltransferase [Syntrophomonadaceae bacterium]
MQLWVTEYQTPSMGLSVKTTDMLLLEKSEFQQVAVVRTVQFGKMLLLDGIIQTTETDEFVYHEMITQIALNAHPAPKRVLIIGGGDGGALREVVGHPAVEEGIMVEIDALVVEASKRFLPHHSEGFDSPKARLIIDDGIKYVKNNPKAFDVIIVDSTDPIGPAVELFSENFYRDVANALNDDGILAVQSESPFFNADIIESVYKKISASFPITKLCLANVPTYPGGLWSFTVGSKKYDPAEINNPRPKMEPFKYYSGEIHKASFILPPFVKDIIS